MRINHYRILSIFCFIICVTLVSSALALQYFDNLNPCPLCIIQRISFLILAIIFFLGIFFYQTKIRRIIVNSFIVIVSILGFSTAARQVWLQHLPKNLVPSCGPGLNFIIKNIPLTEGIKMIFLGSGDCADKQWIFLYLSMAEWSLMFFLGFIFVALIMLFLELRSN